MALLTSKGISRVAIALLQRRLTLPRTVTAIPGEEFAGKNGDTITVRVPMVMDARIQANRGDLLVADDANEIPVDVTLRHIYSLKNVTDQELSFDIENFSRQITRPQVGAVAVGAENEVAAAMNALAPEANFALNASVEDTKARILEARAALGDSEVPPDDRFFAVSPDIATRILSVPEFTKVNEAGSSEALRRAVLGQLFGFTFVESNALDPGEAVAYHRSGFVFANRTPVRPRGATDSATVVEQGIGLRHVFQYDASHAQDQSLISTFGGAAPVFENQAGTVHARFFKLGTSAT